MSAVPASISAVFTQSRFAAPSVTLSREVAQWDTARGVVVIARNANVATQCRGSARGAGSGGGSRSTGVGDRLDQCDRPPVSDGEDPCLPGRRAAIAARRLPTLRGGDPRQRLAGEVDLVEFEQDLYDIALGLVRMIASDGEGASKALEMQITGARDDAQAKRVAKAIGKYEAEQDIDPDKVRIVFGETEAYPRQLDEAGLLAVKGYLQGKEVLISVDLNIAQGQFTVYGCDLSEGYIRINADYTT